jgi:hypothetical protein
MPPAVQGHLQGARRTGGLAWLPPLRLPLPIRRTRSRPSTRRAPRAPLHRTWTLRVRRMWTRCCPAPTRGRSPPRMRRTCEPPPPPSASICPTRLRRQHGCWRRCQPRGRRAVLQPAGSPGWPLALCSALLFSHARSHMHMLAPSRVPSPPSPLQRHLRQALLPHPGVRHRAGW